MLSGPITTKQILHILFANLSECVYFCIQTSMNVGRWFPVPAAAEYLEKLVVQLVQILSQVTFAPAQKDSSCEVVEQSVMVISLVLSLNDPD